jgi:hypothetical protein
LSTRSRKRLVVATAAEVPRDEGQARHEQEERGRSESGMTAGPRPVDGEHELDLKLHR